MELFDVLPERFFGLLAGKCRRIYAEAGLCLYEQYRGVARQSESHDPPHEGIRLAGL